MVKSDFTNFFLAAAGAGAALIGLLFVAISVRPNLLARRDTHPEIQITVAMAFSALVNGFFISLAALLPGAVIGGVALFMGTLSSWNCFAAVVSFVRRLPRGNPKGLSRVLARGLVLVAVGLIIYVWEIVIGWQMLHTPNDAGAILTLANLIIATFGLGLLRAWELLGAQRGTGLLRWFSPLSAEDDLSPPPTASDDTRSPANTKSE